MQDRDLLLSLKKGLDTITLLNRRVSVTVSELAAELKVPRPTAYRLLYTLTAYGYVTTEEGHGGAFRLTPLVTGLASGFVDQSLIVHVASSVLKRLARAVRWPLAYSSPVGDRMIVRVATDRDNPLVLDRIYPGFSMPLLHTSAGRLHLALCTDAERDVLIDLLKQSGDERQRLARDPTQLSMLLRVIREKGYCNTEHDEYLEGSLAVPVMIDQSCVGSIGMRYIKSALKRTQLLKEFLPRLHAAATEIADDVSKYRARELARDAANAAL